MAPPCERQTDGQTHDDSIYRSSIASHGKKTDAAWIPKHDVPMFYDESWKSVHFGVKRSKVNVTSHKNNAGMGLCTLVNAGLF